MSRLALRDRLLLLAVAAALMTGVVGGAAVWSIDRVSGAMGALQARRVQPLVRLDAIARGLERQRAAVLATLAATNDVMMEALEGQVLRDARAFAVAIEALRAAAPGGEERALVDRLAGAISTAEKDGLAAVLGYLRTGQFIEADVASQSRYRPQVDAATSLLDEAIAMQVRLGAAEYRDASAVVRRHAAATIALTLAALAAGLLLALLISRSLTRLLGANEHELVLAARRFAEGRLAHRIELASGDSSSVAASLDRMSHDFSALVERVLRTASHLAESARRLSATSGDLAGRTADQASSLEETAASMQQLSAAVRGNRESATRAEEVSREASAAAHRGREVSAASCALLRRMAESASRVREISSLIDAIAFQTNMLALNAAVEAARAGAHGRGFAVVAAEVRGLAQRCGQSAREIRVLVEETATQAAAAVDSVLRADEAMAEIETATLAAADWTAQIAAVSAEQAAGIGQVDRAIERLDAATQGNAQFADGVAHDAAELAGRADDLLAAVQRFEVKSGGGLLEAPQARPPALPRLLPEPSMGAPG